MNAPLESVQKDAARWRWVSLSILNNYNDVYDILNSAHKMTQAELDAAIDAAIKKTTTGTWP